MPKSSMTLPCFIPSMQNRRWQVDICIFNGRACQSSSTLLVAQIMEDQLRALLTKCFIGTLIQVLTLNSGLPRRGYCCLSCIVHAACGQSAPSEMSKGTK